jgi:hypothetical protein
MPHTPPYRPQGRGKIERVFRTIREQFLDTTPARSLEELRQGFQEWLLTYHRTIHEGLGCSPLQKRATVSSVCRILPEGTPVDPLFFMERRCRVYNDRTITFKRIPFEVPECSPGSRVTIFFDPANPTRIWYGDTLQPARPLDRQANAKRFDHPPSRKERKE